ncbi:DUF4270 domain-containing protein [uncultured Algibacter sp.]|uniref:DUF4270 domain-containing protein n=1 Tax=uncultured Algibacter sp. TaxID=298659 RepID=UPI0026193DC9|nr:DUF4270 domain-containing protein [uncultured Algibacter sp.]
MKKIFKALKFTGAVAFLILTLIACDKEFNSIDSDVLGKENSNFSTSLYNITPLAYNKKLEAVQINGLQSNLLGYYNDPLYGGTTASIITQLVPVAYDPDFGVNPEIESVVLNIPYFSTATGVENEVTTYKLDSLYGNASAPIKLTVYQSNYFLRDFNPEGDPNTAQNYFSKADRDLTNPTHNFAMSNNTTVDFDDQIIGLPILEVSNFTPSPLATEIITGTGEDEVKTYSIPALREELDNDFWKAAIIDKQDDPVLSNANNFKNYFRGLYIKTEAIADNGSMILLNLASTDANITINYTHGETDARTEATYVLNFNGNRLNTFINDYSFNSMPLADGDDGLGDEKLLLKGTAGSMTIIDLFGSEDLESLKADFIEGDNVKRLINEARLTIIEDEQSIDPDDENHEYDRIYAYDINNNNVTADYSFDPTENTAQPLNSKVVSLGQRDTIMIDNTIHKGYKIRITEHIKNIIFRDSMNTKLGLVISNNVNYITGVEIINNNDLERIPAATILTSRGTVLHGSNDNVDAKKRLKLEIYYTEPNN